MPISPPTRERTFSLFDADLSLLAADAAAEIDVLNENLENFGSYDLRYTNELLSRLKSISSSDEKFNVDRVLYEKSLLPSVSQDEQTLFLAPSEVHKRLTSLLTGHNLFKADSENEFLSNLKRFFLEVSAFASASRSMLRIGSSNTPYATL